MPGKGSYTDGQRLIYEVQKRPVLYNAALPDYGDRSKKRVAWEEICEALVVDWKDLPAQDRLSRGQEIQKRWRSMRDAFVKENRKQTSAQSGSEPRRGKQYIYYKRMKFLLTDSLDNQPTSINVKLEDEGLDEVSCEDHFSQQDDEHFSQQTEEQLSRQSEEQGTSQEPTLVAMPPWKLAKSAHFESELLGRLLSRHQPDPLQGSDDDEDRMFLLSLLPSFKKMDYDAKLAARIDILQVVRRGLLMHHH